MEHGGKIMEIDPSFIKTTGDFRNSVLLLANGRAITTPKSLEEYLRALWNLLQQAQTHQVTYALLAQLLDEAFLAKSLPFDETWLQYSAPPTLDEDDNARAFSVLQHMICYQIADLHRMAQTGLLESEWRYFGMDSPTGHRWYNFDPSSYLKCAAQTLREDGISLDAGWIDLTLLLWLGQIYE
jgi:hypothetical protein